MIVEPEQPPVNYKYRGAGVEFWESPIGDDTLILRTDSYFYPPPLMLDRSETFWGKPEDLGVTVPFRPRKDVWMAKANACRWCGGKLKGRNRAWCSAECRTKGWMETSGTTRRYEVLRRDHGVCSSCGIDTRRIERLVRKLVNVAYIGWDPTEKDKRRAVRARRRSRRVGDWLRVNGFERCIGYTHSSGCTSLARSLWEHDHIIPRKEGGSNQLGNLRTLCVPCHADVTRRYSRFRASRARGGVRTYNP